MTDEEMIDNLLTFVTAGHETTSLGLAWTFYLLTRHPAVEARLLAEIDTVTGGGPVQPAHIAQLAYTRQVFSEAMRLYPPAPMVSRLVSEAFVLGGVQIPAGSLLVVPIYALHRHADLWPDPERFDPDRFSPEATAGRSRYAYMPFGAGPRVCIGNGFAMLEAVAILAVLLGRIRLRDVSHHSPTPVMKVTLRPSPDPELQPVLRVAA
jgi:cytochrome P450